MIYFFTTIEQSGQNKVGNFIDGHALCMGADVYRCNYRALFIFHGNGNGSEALFQFLINYSPSLSVNSLDDAPEFVRVRYGFVGKSFKRCVI